MREKPGFKFMHEIYKQRQYTLACAIPRYLLVVLLLLLAAYVTFKTPKSQTHIDYGAKISSLLEIKLPIKVTPEQVSFESTNCNIDKPAFSESIATALSEAATIEEFHSSLLKNSSSLSLKIIKKTQDPKVFLTKDAECQVVAHVEGLTFIFLKFPRMF